VPDGTNYKIFVASSTAPLVGAFSGIFTVDNTKPVVASATASPNPAKAGTVTITVVFTETGSGMDTSGTADPSVTITGLTGSPITVNKSSYSGSTWVGTFSLGANSEQKTATISVSGAKDLAGNTMNANASAGTFTVDTVAPATPVITSIAGDNKINNSEKAAIHVVGTAEANSTVNVSLSDAGNAHTVTGSGTATGGNYDIAIDGTSLNDGTITPSVTATDAAGNTSSAATTPTATKDVVVPSGYTVAINQSYINNANKAAMSFTFAGAEVGTTYNYTITSSGGGGSVTGTNTVGAANATVSSINVTGLPDGTLTLSVTLTDAVGNVGSAATATVTKDVVAPSGYTDSIDQSYINNSNKAAVSFTLNGAEVGTTYSYVFTTSGGAGTVTATGTVGSAGEQITGIDLTGVQDGTVTLSVTLTDTAGNTGSTATNTKVKDVVAPATPVITSIAGDNQINASEASAIHVVGTAEANSTVSVTLSDGTLTASGSGSANGGGAYNVTVNGSSLADGTITPSVTATDAAGNTSSATTTPTATKDVVAPSDYSVAINQSYINSGNQTALSFTFTGAEIGTTYNYTLTSDGGGGPVTGSDTIETTTDTISGIDVTSLNDGTLTLSVTLTDAVGNVGSAATATVTKDVAAPTLSNWSLDMDTGHLVLNFDENVDVSTLVPTGITIQDDRTKRYAQYTLTGGTTESTNGTAIDIALTPTDLNAIKAEPLLAKSSHTTYLTISSAVIMDIAGNSVSAIADGDAMRASDYNGDITAPTVLATTPDYNSAQTGVAVNVSPTITFNKAINPSTVTASTVYISTSPTDNTGIVDAIVIPNSDNTVFTIHPTSNLAPGTAYYLHVTTTVKDVNDNSMAAQFDGTNSFTTAADTATLAVTNISTVANPNGSTGFAVADGTYANGFAWTFNVTASSTQTQLAMEFSNFTSGNNSIVVTTSSPAGIIRYCSQQSSNYNCSGDAWRAISAANTYGGNLTLNSDLDSATAGRQVQVEVEMLVPSGTVGGSYSASYGVQTTAPEEP
jgi:hypothetical protein